jgi:opacity protein-like surface antigen
MKTVKAVLVSIFVMGICKPVSAADFSVNRLKYIGSLDLFTVANADDRMDRRLRAYRSVGTISSYELDTNAALGFRIGALYPIEDVADVGLSWGYISGPSGTSMTVDGDDGSIRDYDFNRRFSRLLAEARKEFKHSDKISFLGGVGLGVAFGREEIVNTGLPDYERGILQPTTSDKYFSGLTWELTAGAVYKATEKLNVEAGLKYAGFPPCPGGPPTRRTGDNEYRDGQFTGMNWSTLGFFAGVSF